MSMPIRGELALALDPATPPVAKPRLLIVDDIADNRDLLSRRFRQRGFETSEAAGGEEALAMIAAQPFDTVLLDVMMPGIDGIEVLSRVRRTFSALELPVIMVTAKSQSEDVVQALQFGANDYVTKPVDFPVALARVKAQVERKRAEDALRHAHDALSEANASLETRIAERTAKLAETNDRLRHEMARQRKFEEKIEYLAHHDALTGLANRALFDEQLRVMAQATRARGEMLAILFMDLDGFKSVNDLSGHSAGDSLLKMVAAKLRDATSATDFVGRLGGDEFAVLHVCDGQAATSAALADRLVHLIADCKSVDGHAVAIGASVGIAFDNEPGTDIEDLLKKADLAMYRAKSDGRGTFRFFSPEMDAALRLRREREQALRIAIAEGAFELYYQPIYSLKENRLTGFEALLRWPHPKWGIASPGDFIPLAEETGLIIPLGEWVIRRACAEAAAWPAGMRVAVNLSPVQFRSKSLISTVVGALSESDLRPDRLELEITESVLLVDNEANLNMLRQLRQIGVRISMDDFGTGYSGLSYLKSFRFDKVKIDRSFVRDLCAADSSRAIVRAVTGLGISFGLTTTAEGVETQEQLHYLREEGCTEIQGYLLSRPQPATQVGEMIRLIAAKGTMADDAA